MKRSRFGASPGLLFGSLSIVPCLAAAVVGVGSLTGTFARQDDAPQRIPLKGGAVRLEDAPAGVDVSTTGGDINIKSASKFVKAQTGGGRIEIGAVDGWVKATTLAGDVSVTLVGDPSQGGKDVEITSHKGDVTLTVPSGLPMDIEVRLTYTKNSSQSFRIVSDFPLEQRVSGNWVYTEGAPRKYIYGAGSVAGGQNKIRIKTFNGSVYLKKSA